jgi:two-component system NtrC family sensor kinase
VTAGARPEQIRPEGEAVHVLLIDDNADYLLLIRRALEHRDPNVRVTGVVSPDEGLQLLRRQHFDLVLLDYKLPRGGNGLQLVRALKHEATFIPTVMVTAFGDESLAIQAMREGALDFVPKTSDFIQALPDVVARAIDRGRIIRDRISTQRALERRNRELQALLDVAGALQASLDRDVILEGASSRMAELLGARSVVTHLKDESERWLTRVGHGPGPDRIDLAEPARHVAVRAVASRAIAVEQGSDGGVEVGVPLLAQGRALGVMTFRIEDGEVVEREAELCASVGRQIGVALEHARLYHQVAVTEARLRDLVDNAGDEVVTVDPWGRIVSWNAGAAAIYGWSAAEMIGADWEALWPQDRQGEARELLARVLERGETLGNRETVRVTREGERVDILLTLSPLSDPDGSHRGVSCIGKNVTLQKQLQAQLMQSEKMATVGGLISGVAHELNNPLTAILGYSQLVAEADVGAKLPVYLQRISNEAQRSQRIVQNLLAFARKNEPQASRIAINDVVRGALELAAYELRGAGITVVEDLGEGLPSTLADPHQLQQVFLNLLTNARHALKDRGRNARLILTTRLDEAGLDGRPALVVAFEDNGPGVPAPLRRKIFDPFFTTKRDGEGTGLGLSLSYGIVQEHGGRLSLGEPADGGARFEIRLPVLAAGTSTSRRATDAAGAAPADPQRRRILVVEDQPSVREMVSDVLRMDGHDIETAQDGTQALDKILGSDPFDLIIVDLKLPDFGGDRLWREVSNMKPELARRMVLAGGETPEDQRRVEGTGARWLPKPYGADDVRRTVSSFFQPGTARPAGHLESA